MSRVLSILLVSFDIININKTGLLYIKYSVYLSLLIYYFNRRVKLLSSMINHFIKNEKEICIINDTIIFSFKIFICQKKKKKCYYTYKTKKLKN